MSTSSSVWVCGKCFEQNDTTDSCCANCGTEKKGPMKRLLSDRRVERRCPETTVRTPRPISAPHPLPEKKKEVARVKPFISNGVDKSELRMVLIGKTGVGKSSTANNILGSQVFKAKSSPKSVTEKCNFDRSERFGKRILLVDTPGLFDTSIQKNIIENEVKKCIGISAPGPHAFLLVMSFTNRFTEEEKKVLEEVSNMFGDQMIKYLIVVFTGRDQIDKGSCIEKHIEEYPEEFRSLVLQAGGGYITFNNRGSDSEKEEDVKGLLYRIDQMVKKNGGGNFTSEMFEAAENVIQQRIANELAAQREQFRKEVEDEIRMEVEREMRSKMNAEQSRLKHLHERDLQQYKVLKLKMEKERNKDGKKKLDESFRTSVRPALIDEMRANAEKKLLRQIEETEGTERAEVHKQLAGAGREIQQLLQRRRAEAEDSTFAEDAKDASERYLEKLRNEERENIQMETGILQRLKEKLKGFGTGFLDLFRD